MAKMREVNRSKVSAAHSKYTLAPMVIDGQTVMVKVLKPVAAPKGLTARCQG